MSSLHPFSPGAPVMFPPNFQSSSYAAPMPSSSSSISPHQHHHYHSDHVNNDHHGITSSSSSSWPSSNQISNANSARNFYNSHLHSDHQHNTGCSMVMEDDDQDHDDNGITIEDDIEMMPAVDTNEKEENNSRMALVPYYHDPIASYSVDDQYRRLRGNPLNLKIPKNLFSSESTPPPLTTAAAAAAAAAVNLSSKIYTLPYFDNVDQFRRDSDPITPTASGVIIEEITSDDDDDDDHMRSDQIEMTSGNVSDARMEVTFPSSVIHNADMPYRANKRRMEDADLEGSDAEVESVERRLHDIGLSRAPKKRRIDDRQAFQQFHNHNPYHSQY